MTPRLTIREIRTVGVEIPMNYPLGTSRGVLSKAPLLLVDLETEEGITGRAYLWCYLREALPAVASILKAVADTVRGETLAPADLWEKLSKRFALIGVQGIVRMAMAGCDVAAWDALSAAAGMPLASFVGSKPKAIRAYNSCGLGGQHTPASLADEAEALLARGFTAVKLRLGYDTLQGDLAAIDAVRKRIGNGVTLMVDYNQGLTRAQALERGRALDQQGLYWLEEPIRHDDYEGAAMLADAFAIPIQIGENFSEPREMERALSLKAADYVMPDLERIGGVTGWLRAAGLAAAHGIEMSSHLYPEVSAHLLAATPTCHFLEYVDWAEKILEAPIEISNGMAIIPDRPGSGVNWNAKAVERYRI